jgi:hypothetical protein
MGINEMTHSCRTRLLILLVLGSCTAFGQVIAKRWMYDSHKEPSTTRRSWREEREAIYTTVTAAVVHVPDSADGAKFKTHTQHTPAFV